MPAFVTSFTVSPDKSGAIIIYDTSNYPAEAKTTFSDREIIITKADGTATTIPFQFNKYKQDKITINLERDYCLKISLKLTSQSPQLLSRYLAYVLMAFNAHTIQYLTNLSQSVTLSSKKSLGANFYKTVAEVLVNNDGALFSANALKQIESQSCLDRNYRIISQQVLI